MFTHTKEFAAHFSYIKGKLMDILNVEGAAAGREEDLIAEFLRWAKANHWHQCIHDENWLHKPGLHATPTYKTTAQLYELFKQQKEK